MSNHYPQPDNVKPTPIDVQPPSQPVVCGQDFLLTVCVDKLMASAFVLEISCLLDTYAGQANFALNAPILHVLDVMLQTVTFPANQKQAEVTVIAPSTPGTYVLNVAVRNEDGSLTRGASVPITAAA